MGAVYQAEHLALGRTVAVKLLHPALADDRDAIARLRQEAQVVGAIGHPNICQIFDLGQTQEGRPYLIMEHLVGQTLGKHVAEHGPMSFFELAPIACQVLDALEAVHAKGVLHRDLKPENVFLQKPWPSRRGAHVKLLDFGVSKTIAGAEFGAMKRLTHTGMVMGTPYYMAPEQARGESLLDHRVDLWAVAVILYEALTGRRPFVATNYNALLVKILTSQPRPVQKLRPEVPDVVAALVDRGLIKLREDRYQDAADLRRAVVEAELQCLADDAHEPTRVMVRAQQTSVPQPVATAADWSARIEDPETYIDDEWTEVDAPMELPVADPSSVWPGFLDDERTEVDGPMDAGPIDADAAEQPEPERESPDSGPEPREPSPSGRVAGPQSGAQPTQSADAKVESGWQARAEDTVVTETDVIVHRK